MMIKDVKAIYTGGNIWLFCGSLADGKYFIVDDNGWAGLFDADGYEMCCDSDYDTWEEYYSKHHITDLLGNERRQFCSDMLDKLTEYEYGSDNNGGMTRNEIEAYREYFKEEA